MRKKPDVLNFMLNLLTKILHVWTIALFVFAAGAIAFVIRSIIVDCIAGSIPIYIAAIQLPIFVALGISLSVLAVVFWRVLRKDTEVV